jgi:hypothetical protein
MTSRGSSEFRPILGQLRGTHGKHVHLGPAHDEPEVFEQSTDLVLNIPYDLDEQGSADEKGLDRVTVEGLSRAPLCTIRIA